MICLFRGSMGNLEPQVRNCSNLFAGLNKRHGVKTMACDPQRNFQAVRTHIWHQLIYFCCLKNKGCLLEKQRSVSSDCCSDNSSDQVPTIHMVLSCTFIKLFGSQPLTLVKKDCWSTIGGNVDSTAVVFFPYRFAELFMLLCPNYKYS